MTVRGAMIMGGLAALSVSGGAGLAQSGAALSPAAQQCLALATDAERLSCMQDALAAAEAALAGSRAAPAPAAAPRPDADAGSRGGLLGLFGGGARSSGGEATGIGAEQIQSHAQRAQDEERAAAQVVGFREIEPGVTQFELDNGQVWRQARGDRARLNLFASDRPAVEVWKAWTGGYRMRLLDRDQVVQVQRIR